MSLEFEAPPGWVGLLTWVETHKRSLILGGILAMLAGTYIYIASWQTSQKEQAAGDALYELQSKKGEVLSADYLSVASDFEGTSAAKRALLMAGRAHFIAGEYDEARDIFHDFQIEDPSSSFLPIALFGEAAAHDANGDLSEAKVAYQAVLNRFPNDPIAPQARLAMASLHESESEFLEAFTLYDALDRQGISASFSSRARARKEKLLDKYPDLRLEIEAFSNEESTKDATSKIDLIEENDDSEIEDSSIENSENDNSKDDESQNEDHEIGNHDSEDSEIDDSGDSEIEDSQNEDSENE